MFYLIFGQAYSRNHLRVDLYNALCVNKDTKIRMPKIKNEDDTDIEGAIALYEGDAVPLLVLANKSEQYG